MALEYYANNASTTLSGDITSGATSLVVASTTNFPTSPQFRLIIDAEYLLVTGVNGTTFTVSRGVESSTAAAHTSGAVVTQILTAGAIPEIFRRHAYFVRQASLNVSDFSQVNTSGCTIIASGGVISMKAPVTSQQVRSILKALPAVSGYTITVPLWFNSAGNGISGGGLILRDSVTTASYAVALAGNNSFLLQKWNSDVSFSALYTNLLTLGTDWRRYGKPIWIQVQDDGTNRITRVSPDNLNFELMHTVGRTDFVTPNQYGFFIDPEGSGDDRILTAWDIVLG